MPRNRRDKGGGVRMDTLYNSVEFRMYCFKVLTCSKHYCHDWTDCPFAHPGEKARRRDPRVFRYVGIECPQAKEGGRCPRGDLCPFAHNVFECWLHPTRYRTQLCNEPASCKRKVCFFAHTVEELREPTTGLEHLREKNGAPAAVPASGAPHSMEHRLSMDASSVAQSSAACSPAWGVRDALNREQPPPQEAALLAAVMQLQGGQQSAVPPTDLVGQLEQMSLLQGASGLSAGAGNKPGCPGAPGNEQVCQLLLLLLKEMADKRQSQEQQARKSFDEAALAVQQRRASLDTMMYQASSQLQPHVARKSLDNNLRRMSFNMLGSMSTTQPIQEDHASVADITYLPSTGMSRISLDSSLPDFILHDTRARAPSMDSNISETLGLARAGRMSIDSCSSFLSGDRRLSSDASADMVRLAAIQGEMLPVPGMPEAFVPRYETRPPVDPRLPGNRVYQSEVLRIPAVNLPAGD